MASAPWASTIWKVLLTKLGFPANPTTEAAGQVHPKGPRRTAGREAPSLQVLCHHFEVLFQAGLKLGTSDRPESYLPQRHGNRLSRQLGTWSPDQSHQTRTEAPGTCTRGGAQHRGSPSGRRTPGPGSGGQGPSSWRRHLALTCMPQTLTPSVADVLCSHLRICRAAFSADASSPCCRVPIFRSSTHGHLKWCTTFSSSRNSAPRSRQRQQAFCTGLPARQLQAPPSSRGDATAPASLTKRLCPGQCGSVVERGPRTKGSQV